MALARRQSCSRTLEAVFGHGWNAGMRRAPPAAVGPVTKRPEGRGAGWWDDGPTESGFIRPRAHGIRPGAGPACPGGRNCLRVRVRAFWPSVGYPSSTGRQRLYLDNLGSAPSRGQTCGRVRTALLSNLPSASPPLLHARLRPLGSRRAAITSSVLLHRREQYFCLGVVRRMSGSWRRLRRGAPLRRAPVPREAVAWVPAGKRCSPRRSCSSPLPLLSAGAEAGDDASDALCRVGLCFLLAMLSK